MNFSIAIELCRKYGLPELEKRLYSLKHTSEGPVLEQSPVMSDPGVRPSDGCRNRLDRKQSRRAMRALGLGESGTEINPRHHQEGPLLMGQCKRKTFMRWIQAQT